MSCRWSASSQLTGMSVKRGEDIESTHIDSEVSVQERLELPRLPTIVLDLQAGVELSRAERDAVRQAKVLRPGLLRLVVQHVAAEAEVELD